MTQNAKAVGHYARSVLLSWLNDVCENMRLTRSTFYKAVLFVDSLLSRRKRWVLGPRTFQAMGAACLLTASKSYDANYVIVKDLVYLGNNSYTAQDVIEWEAYLLQQLDVTTLGAPSLCEVAWECKVKIPSSLVVLLGDFPRYPYHRWVRVMSGVHPSSQTAHKDDPETLWAQVLSRGGLHVDSKHHHNWLKQQTQQHARFLRS